jgi:phage-related protein
VPWRVEILNETVAAEIAALPADMQARFLRLAERICQAGLESLGEPHVKHLEGKLWELRLTGRDGIARALRSNLRSGERRRSHDHSIRET